MKWDDISGWFDWEVTYREIIARYPGGTLVEVGCYLGRSLCCLGRLAKESGKSFRVVGVDTCRGTGVENGHDNHLAAVESGGGTFAGQLHRNVVACGLEDVVTLVVGSSLAASHLFADESLTAVWLDAAHDHESVLQDIYLWKNKMRRGGVIGGDDMGVPGEEPVWPGVGSAVRQVFGTDWEYKPHDAWWHVRK